MAKTDILYTCGCSFKTKDPDKALNHCDAEGHTITVLGTIRPEVVHETKKAAHPQLAREPLKGIKDFDDLRKRLIQSK